MKKRFKKLTIISSIAILSSIAISFSAITVAKYVEGKDVAQSAFGLGGEREISIFFNANKWKEGLDSSGNIVDAAFYLYVWNHNDSTEEDSLQEVLIPSAHVTPTISNVVMDLYVYEFDATKLNRMIFLRWNPNNEPSTTLSAENGMWNQTTDITYSSLYNYYCIDDWGTGDPAVATPKSNKILYSENNLVWATDLS